MTTAPERRMHCPDCQGAIHDQSVDADGIATCPACEAQFRVGWPAPPPPEGKPTAEPPSETSLERGRDEIVIRQPWRYAADWLYHIYSPLAFMMAAIALNVTTEYAPRFWIALVLVWVPVAYVWTAGLMNQTEIRVSRDKVRLRHGPIPWPGRCIAVADLRQLYVRKRKHFRRRPFGTKHAPPCSYPVHALLRGGKSVLLVHGGAEREVGLFVEQQVEAFLGIDDRWVLGEHSGSEPLRGTT